MTDFVEVTTQAALDAAIADSNIPVCRSGHFTVSDSASVRASGSASVEAFDSVSVEATPHVAVQRHGTKAKVQGGVLIQIPELDTPGAWCEFYGVTVDDGHATLFKGVDNQLVSAHGTSYRPGDTVACDNWDPHDGCGNGLHFSPRPFMARKYVDAERFVACQVKLSDVVVISGYGLSDKVKAPGCVVLFECTEDGEPVEAAQVAP